MKRHESYEDMLDEKDREADALRARIVELEAELADVVARAEAAEASR